MVEPRVGLSRARNTGIDAAAADLIAFLNTKSDNPQNLTKAAQAPAGSQSR